MSTRSGKAAVVTPKAAQGPRVRGAAHAARSTDTLPTAAPNAATSSSSDPLQQRRLEIEKRLAELRAQRTAAPGAGAAGSATTTEVPSAAVVVAALSTAPPPPTFDPPTCCVGGGLVWSSSGHLLPFDADLLSSSSNEHTDAAACRCALGETVAVGSSSANGPAAATRELDEMETQMLAFSGALNRARDAGPVHAALTGLLGRDPMRRVYVGESGRLVRVVAGLCIDEFKATLPDVAVLEFADGATKAFLATHVHPKTLGVLAKEGANTAASASSANTAASAPVAVSSGDAAMRLIEERMRQLEERQRQRQQTDAGVSAAPGPFTAPSVVSGATATDFSTRGLANLSTFNRNRPATLSAKPQIAAGRAPPPPAVPPGRSPPASALVPTLERNDKQEEFTQDISLSPAPRRSSPHDTSVKETPLDDHPHHEEVATAAAAPTSPDHHDIDSGDAAYDYFLRLQTHVSLPSSIGSFGDSMDEDPADPADPADRDDHHDDGGTTHNDNRSPPPRRDTSPPPLESLTPEAALREPQPSPATGQKKHADGCVQPTVAAAPAPASAQRVVVVKAAAMEASNVSVLQSPPLQPSGLEPFCRSPPAQSPEKAPRPPPMAPIAALPTTAASNTKQQQQQQQHSQQRMNPSAAVNPAQSAAVVVTPCPVSEAPPVAAARHADPHSNNSSSTSPSKAVMTTKVVAHAAASPPRHQGSPRSHAAPTSARAKAAQDNSSTAATTAPTATSSRSGGAAEGVSRPAVTATATATTSTNSNTSTPKAGAQQRRALVFAPQPQTSHTATASHAAASSSQPASSPSKTLLPAATTSTSTTTTTTTTTISVTVASRAPQGYKPLSSTCNVSGGGVVGGGASRGPASPRSCIPDHPRAGPAYRPLFSAQRAL